MHRRLFEEGHTRFMRTQLPELEGWSDRQIYEQEQVRGWVEQNKRHDDAGAIDVANDQAPVETEA